MSEQVFCPAKKIFKFGIFLNLKPKFKKKYHYLPTGQAETYDRNNSGRTNTYIS